MISACTQYGFALSAAPPELKDDDEVVLIAVAQNGRALGYASEALRKRRDIVHVATSNSRYALQVI